MRRSGNKIQRNEIKKTAIIKIRAFQKYQLKKVKNFLSKMKISKSKQTTSFARLRVTFFNSEIKLISNQTKTT